MRLNYSWGMLGAALGFGRSYMPLLVRMKTAGNCEVTRRWREWQATGPTPSAYYTGLNGERAKVGKIIREGQHFDRLFKFQISCIVAFRHAWFQCRSCRRWFVGRSGQSFCSLPQCVNRRKRALRRRRLQEPPDDAGQGARDA